MGRYKRVQVEVDLDDFDDEDLIDELEFRGIKVELSDYSDDELLEHLESRGVSYLKSHVTCEQLLDAWLLYPDKFEDLFRTYCRENIGKSFS
jgi:hypothetical protein